MYCGSEKKKRRFRGCGKFEIRRHSCQRSWAVKDDLRERRRPYGAPASRNACPKTALDTNMQISALGKLKFA